MTQPVKRVRLKSLSDIQRVMANLYRENRADLIEDGKLTVLSQHLNRLHTQMITAREIDVHEQLAEIEAQLADMKE